jgi:hypothetical protein
MSTIGGGDGAIRRTLRPDFAADLAARASEAARRLAASLEESRAWGPQEAARLVDEVRRLPAEAQEAFLAAAAGSRSTAREWAERIARACPLSPDTVERARSFGPFGPPSTPVSPGPGVSPAVAPGPFQPGSGFVPASAAVAARLEGLPASWRTTLARVQEMAPGLVNAIAPMGRAESAVAAARAGLAGIDTGEGFWARARRAASEDALGRVASRFEILRSRVNAGVETAEAVSAGARGGLLGSLARELRAQVAATRQDVASVRELVGEVDLDQQGSTPPLSRAEEEMRAAEYGLEGYVASQDLVSEARSAGEGRINQEELDRLGTGLTPPPPQGFWNIGTVGAGLEPAFSSAECGQAASTAAAGLLGESPTSVRTIDGAELAAAIRDMRVPLEQVDPNQLNAAVAYINAGGSGAVAEFGRGAPKTVEEQRERVTLALRQFRSLAEQGPPSMDRRTAIEVMWSAARIPGHAFEKMSDAEVLAAAQRTAAACNTPGTHEFKVGKHTVKLTIGEGGSVLSTSTKAPGFWSGLGRIAKGALTVASFLPPPAGLVARGIQAGIAFVNAARHGGGLLDIVSAGASFVGAGAAAVGRMARAGSSLAGVAGNVARVANSFSGAARGVEGIERGSLGGALTGAAGVANGLSGVLQGAGATANPSLGHLADDLSSIGRTLGRVGAGIGAAEGYIQANRAVAAAREELQQARATGDPAQIQAAERRLAEAEEGKRSAVLGGLAATGQIAGDTLSRNSQGQTEPRTAQMPVTGRSGFQVGAEIFSRGMATARGINEDDLLAAGAEALGGLAAARQGTRPLREEKVIGPDGLPIVLKDLQGNPLVDEHGNRLYLTTDDFDLVNEASSVLDGLADWRQAARAEGQAREAVDRAEQALSLARALGDPEAIREAEASLREMRQGLVRADLDRTLAQGSAAERFTGAVDTFENSRAADGYRAEQERQTKQVAASLDRAKSLAADLAQVIDDPRFSITDRQQAAELRETLTMLALKYESDVAGAAEAPRRLAEINEEYVASLAGIDEQVPHLRVAALGVQDWEAPLDTGGTTSNRDIRAEALKHVEIDERILREAEKEIGSAPRDREGFTYEDPRLAPPAADMKKAVDELKALASDPNATEDDILAASLRLNVARNALTQTRNPPPPGTPAPFVVGLTTFVEEFGSRAADLITLGGKRGIEEALRDGRLNANSDFLDVTKAYWEGVLNGVSFGGAGEYWQSRADHQSVVDSLALGALRFGEGVFAVDEYKVLTDPKTNDWQKAEALSSMVAKYAALGAGGKTLQERITARTLGRTQAVSPADSIASKSGPEPGTWVTKARRGGTALEHQARMSGQDVVVRDGRYYIDEYEVRSGELEQGGWAVGRRQELRRHHSTGPLPPSGGHRCAGRSQVQQPAARYETRGHHRHPGADGERSATSADD